MLSERWKYFWYELLYYPVAAFFFFMYSLRVKGRRNVPKTGGLLVISNHQSYFDPPLIGTAARRHLSYLARKSLFRFRAFSWLIDSLGAIPINQDTSGTEGIKASLAALKQGKALLIFPEGSRTPDGAMHELRPGVVVLVQRAKAPVLPVGIAGVYHAWPVHRLLPRFAPLFLPAESGTLAVVIGKPIAPEDLAGLPREQVLARLEGALRSLHTQAEKLRRKG